MVEEKYRNLWRRGGALLVDALLFLPLLCFSSWLYSSVPDILLWQSLGRILSWVSVVYSVLMHGFKGQTVGKMALKVKVYDLSGQPLSMRQAILRDIVEIIFNLIATGWLVATLVSSSAPLTAEATGSAPLQDWLPLINSLGYAWLILDPLVALLNNKRRAIHDFIAGSVVIREAAKGRKESKPRERKKSKPTVNRFKSLPRVAQIVVVIAAILSVCCPGAAGLSLLFSGRW